MIIIWFSSKKKVPKLTVTTREKLFWVEHFSDILLLPSFLLYKLIRSAHKSCFCATAYYVELLINPHIPQQRFCFRNEKGSCDEDLFEKMNLHKGFFCVKLNENHLTVFLGLFNSPRSGLYYIYSDLVIFQISYFFSEEEYQQQLSAPSFCIIFFIIIKKKSGGLKPCFFMHCIRR